MGEEACCAGQSGRGAGVEAHCVSLRDRGGGTCAALGGGGKWAGRVAHDTCSLLGGGEGGGTCAVLGGQGEVGRACCT